jgi:TolB-like protein/Tfp pilus assembly protein PilF
LDGESVGSRAQSDARGCGAPIIPRYQTIAKLGEGGNGVVYKAKDLTLDRIVALKFLLSNDVEQKARFLQEARAAASLSHPNVCVVHEVGEAEGKPYIVMEFVEGEDLRSKVSNGPLELSDALSLVVQAAEGLREAHHKDIVHRDVKSANIMVTQAGQAKVTDFGLARSMNDTKITKTGVRLGTPSFMSPEQALGNEVDQRSDIWSLCVVLYELVAGQLPFKGEVEASVAYSIVHEEHQPLTSLRSGLPLDLDYVLEKGLEKDPNDRYQHIDDLIVDLREIIDQSASEPDAGASVRLRASAATRRVRKRASKWFSPQRVSLLAAVLAGLALFAVLTVQDPGPSPADAPEVATVTVLPITATGGAVELQVFTDGLIETITRRLSQYENENEQLVVVSPSEVLRQQVATPSDAFAKFGSRYAIEGSLQSEGEAVRLVLTLVETASGSQVDTAVIDGRRDAALSLQDSAVVGLATLLKLTVSDEHAAELARLRPAAPGAYEFYLQARGYLRRNDRLQDIDAAIEVFGRALEADSDYALALSGLCEAYWYRYQRTKETEWVPKARENCNRALELNDEVAEIHATMGTLLRGTGEYGKALLSFQTAVDLDPRSGEAFGGLARTYESLGATDKAEATFQQAVRLRPTGTRISNSGFSIIAKENGRRRSSSTRKWCVLHPTTPTGIQTLVRSTAGSRIMQRRRDFSSGQSRLNPDRRRSQTWETCSRSKENYKKPSDNMNGRSSCSRTIDTTGQTWLLLPEKSVTTRAESKHTKPPSAWSIERYKSIPRIRNSLQTGRIIWLRSGTSAPPRRTSTGR